MDDVLWFVWEEGEIWGISGGNEGRMGSGIDSSSSSLGMFDRDEVGGTELRMGAESQLGVVSGFRFIVMPGRRLAGWDWRCSMKVTW